jgi:hypothetical protein
MNDDANATLLDNPAVPPQARQQLTTAEAPETGFAEHPEADTPLERRLRDFLKFTKKSHLGDLEAPPFANEFYEYCSSNNITGQTRQDVFRWPSRFLLGPVNGELTALLGEDYVRQREWQTVADWVEIARTYRGFLREEAMHSLQQLASADWPSEELRESARDALGKL